MRRVLLLGDLVSRIHAHFAPRVTEIEFYEDWSGIDYIRVHNNDGTFELFQFDTTPTADQLIIDILAATSISDVTGFEIVADHHVISTREREKKFEEITKNYGIPADLTPGEWYKASIDEALRDIALAEWEQWFDYHIPVNLR